MPPRYQKIRELGRNPAGGRITFLAQDNELQETVVIKQFQFAKSGKDWSGYKALEREIQVLRSLKHPSIPRYLRSFETSNGFCMVQEYKEAAPLANPRTFESEEIRQITIQLLEILIYLQQQVPPVIHRDLKPENILLDDNLQVYLIDFGFARISTQHSSLSSVAAGTFGFMPPEQIYNRQLTKATDLYGVGATLICLVTQTPSQKIETLINHQGQILFQPLVSDHLSIRFVNWLEKMVKSNLEERFSNAEIALEEFHKFEITRSPEVRFVPLELSLKSEEIGEELTGRVTVINPVSDILLKGNWQVVPHSHDPRRPQGRHAWITIEPETFQGNEVDCRVTIKTRKLMAEREYERELRLKSNGSTGENILKISVQTAPLSYQLLPLRSLSILLIISCFFGMTGSLINPLSGGLEGLIIGLVIGGIGGLGAAFGVFSLLGKTVFIMVAIRLVVIFLVSFSSVISSIWGYFLGLLLFAGTGYILRHNFGQSKQGGYFYPLLSAVLSTEGFISLFTTFLGLVLGILWMGNWSILGILILAAIALPLGRKIFQVQQEKKQRIEAYRKSVRFLIEP